MVASCHHRVVTRVMMVPSSTGGRDGAAEEGPVRSDVAVIGVIKEARPGESRVAATPATVSLLRRLGNDVVVEPGVGDGSSLADDAYTAAGATTGGPAAADLLAGVRAPSP